MTLYQTPTGDSYGGGSVLGGSAPRPIEPAKTTTQQEQEQQTSQVQQTSQQTSTTQEQQQTGTSQQQSTGEQSLSQLGEEELKALNELIAQLSSGGDPVTNALNAANVEAVTALPTAVQTKEEAVAGVQGDVGAITRQFENEVLPAILGAQEGAGIQSSALSALLAQQGNVQSAEAIARVVQDAISNQTEQQIAATQATTQAAAAPNQAINQTLSAIDVAKGAQQESTSVSGQTGQTTQQLTGTTDQLATGTAESTGTSSGTTTGEGTSDLEAAQAELALAQANQLTQQAQLEQQYAELALLQASLGPNTNISDLTINPYSPNAPSYQSQLQQDANNALAAINNFV